MNWTTEITHVSKPNFFVDEQRFGPYRFWHHQHFFREVDGGVEIRDLIHYLLFHDQMAGVVNRLIVAPRLKKIFDYRLKALHTIFT
jgi:ligand-binding SRPBCC domain-containing protein